MKRKQTTLTAWATKPKVSAAMTAPAAELVTTSDSPLVHIAAPLTIGPTCTEIATSNAIPVLPIHPNDLANFVNKKLDDTDRYNILQSETVFLKEYPLTKGRRFNNAYLLHRPWLRYSAKLDAILCASCICFGDSKQMDYPTFAVNGFNKWKKCTGDNNSLTKHSSSQNHKDADAKSNEFMMNMKRNISVRSAISHQYAQQMVLEKKGIISVIDVIIALGERGIALRGHNYDQEIHEEDGNFNYFLNWKAHFHKETADHLAKAPKNAKYTSPQTQNEIINLCHKNIRNKIVAQIGNNPWSIMADETEDVSSTKQLSVCVRYVHEDEVREEFLGFAEIDKADASTIAAKIIETANESGLNLSNLVGQGYDGASVMSSPKNGVNGIIARQYPKALFVHCRSHNLALVVSSSCKAVPHIRNLFDDVQQITWFISGSAKRKFIFETALADNLDDSAFTELFTRLDGQFKASNDQILQAHNKKSVPKFSPTRWSARVDTLSTIIAKYSVILDTLDGIIENSQGDARRDAQSYKHKLLSTELLVSLFTSQFVLSFLANVTKSLQKKSCNLSDAHSDVTLSKESIQNVRNQATWNRLWEKLNNLARENSLELRKPRITSKQMHRPNAGGVSGSISEYYKINIFYPFVDHVLEELSNRFSCQFEDALSVELLLSENLHKLDSKGESDISSAFSKYLTNTEMAAIGVEISKWKIFVRNIPDKEKPTDILSCMKKCQGISFPVLRKILQTFITMPVGSVACERSFSGLRRLKLWTRSTMKEDRLAGLAMLMIHQGSEFKPSPEEIYEMKKNWRHIKHS